MPITRYPEEATHESMQNMQDLYKFSIIDPENNRVDEVLRKYIKDNAKYISNRRYKIQDATFRPVRSVHAEVPTECYLVTHLPSCKYWLSLLQEKTLSKHVPELFHTIRTEVY